MRFIKYDGKEYRLPNYQSEFHDKLFIHLVDWKWSQGLFDPGVDSGIEYDHIIPHEVQELNLLKPLRKQIQDSALKQGIKDFHHGFGHLNSSQAMCFNFFGSFANDVRLLSLLLSVIFPQKDISTDCTLNSQFEFKSSRDRMNRAAYPKDKSTNFDFFVSTLSQNFYFEIKYSEDGFKGYAPPFKSTLENKYKTMYQYLAKGVIKEEYNCCEGFLTNYQIMRNIVHLNDENKRVNYVIFVYPEGNEKVASQALSAKHFLEPKYQERFITMSWESLYQRCLSELTKQGLLTRLLKEQFEEFKDKYFF